MIQRAPGAGIHVPWTLFEFASVQHTSEGTFSQVEAHKILQNNEQPFLEVSLGPVVQSIVSLKSSLRDIMLKVLADSIYNILKFFAEKM